MHKRYIPVMLSLLVTGFAVADEPVDREQKMQTEPVTQQGDATDDDRVRSPAPASSFTPSEKVSADSAVSFPVDI